MLAALRVVLGLPARGRSWYHWRHEPCWVVRRKGDALPFIGSRDQSTVWSAPSSKMIMSGSTEVRQDHPTQKPVLLAEMPITNHLRAGGLIYDPFIGSGTTLIAAERLGRRAYAMDIDPRYVQITSNAGRR
jgi:DNA modification methylase